MTEKSFHSGFSQFGTVTILVGSWNGALRRILAYKLRGPERAPWALGHVDTTDGSARSHVPAPLPGRDEEWDGRTEVIPVPSEDYLREAQDGEWPGRIDYLHPDIIRKWSGGEDVGTGNVPAVGNATSRVREFQLRRMVEDLVRTAQEADPVGASVSEPPSELRVRIVFSSHGGTHGMVPQITRVVKEVCSDKAVDPMLQWFFALPGANESRDFEKSQANSFGFLKELCATATGRCIDVRTDRVGRAERYGRPPVIPIVLCDLANTPVGTPAPLSEAEHASLIADALILNSQPNFASRLAEDLEDFRKDLLGESIGGRTQKDPSVGISMGISSITLDRGRVAQFARSILRQDADRLLLGPPSSSGDGAQDEVTGEVIDFANASNLSEGEGHAELSRQIKRASTRDSHPTLVSEFEDAFESRLSAQAEQGRSDPTDLLARIDSIHESARKQVFLREKEGVIESTAEKVARVKVSEVRQWIERAILNSDAGLRGARSRLKTLRALLEELIPVVEEELPSLRDRLTARKEELEEFAETKVSRYLNRWFPYRWAIGIRSLFSSWPSYSERGEQLIETFRQKARGVEQARIALQAKEGVVDLLRQLRDAIDPLVSHLDQLEQELQTDEAQHGKRAARIEEWNGTMQNPNGVRLDDDLERVLEYALPQSPEETTRSVVRQLPEMVELLDEEPETLTETLGQRIDEEIEKHLTNLDVYDCLRDLYAEELEDILERAELRSFERIPLSDTEDVEGVKVLRYLVGDQSRLGSIRDQLNQIARRPGRSNRRTFQVVESGSAEKIHLVQVRVRFRFSRIRTYDSYREAYDKWTQRQQELVHTLPGYRFLPNPGSTPTRIDRERALLRAFLTESLKSGGRQEGLAFRGRDGNELPLGPDLSRLADFPVHVEIVSRLYALFREEGETPLRRRLNVVQNAGEDAGLVKTVSRHVSEEAIEQVRDEIDYFQENTFRPAAFWSRSQPHADGETNTVHLSDGEALGCVQ